MSGSPIGAAGAVVWRPLAELGVHPCAGEVPPLTAGEFQALKVDIAERGVLQPLEITEAGIVLDGRARLQALRELGRSEARVVVVAAEDELAYMLRAALVRRQLSASQCAALAVKLCALDDLRAAARERSLANLQPGGERATLPAPGERVRERVAEIAGTSERTVQDALCVKEHDPELFERVVGGELSANIAASKVRRALRDAALPAAPPLPSGPFELILADPPWSLGSPDSQFAPEQHYPCMTLDELRALQLPAGENCVLFTWCVSMLLPEALALIDHWGFRYKANLVWVKNGIGPGVWLRQEHELLLIAIRGNVSPPDPEQRRSSVIKAARTRHSEKPEASYELIEQMYPSLSKLELFARGTPRPGWTSWGNEAEPAAASR